MQNKGKRHRRQARKRAALAILIIACLAVIGGGIYMLSGGAAAFFGQETGKQGMFGSAGSDGTTGGVKKDPGDLIGSESSGPSGTEVRQTEESSGETGEETPTPQSTADSGEAQSGEQFRALIEEADRLAAGYDYDRAIELLRSVENAEEIPELETAVLRYEKSREETVKYSPISEITHVFYHSLIVDTGLAFDGDRDQLRYNEVMTTVEEFEKIMQEMYDRGYVLISIHDMAHLETRPDGTAVMTAGEIYLPPGKKPYVLSVDDLSYYHYMEGDGFASRIVIDEEGKPVCEYIQPDGTTVVGAFDGVPLVDAFVEKHPDAAYRGARGIVALTGYNGVLGYRTDPAYQTGNGLDASQKAWLDAHPEFDYEKECADARAVAEAMKADGWEFACHSYGHLSYQSASYEDVVWDVDTWKSTVELIVGATDVMIYPFGGDIGDWHPYTADNAKYQYLKSLGFHYFCNVDSSRYWVQMGSDYLRQGRRNLDGIRMWQAVSGQKDLLSDLFDAKEIFDPARPTPVQ